MQKNSAFLWRPFVQWQTKETFCFTKCYQPYNYGNLLLLLRWRKWLRRCTGLMRICFIVTPVRNKVGRFFFFFFFICFSAYFKNQNIYLRKQAVKAAKSNRLSLRRVKICLRKIRSLRCRFTQNWVFLHTLFLENKAQIDRNSYGTMLFMSKQVSLPKISSILQKMKIGQNSIYALFARRPSIKMNK